MRKTLTRVEIAALRDKLITLEHGKFHTKGGQWACECFPDEKVKALHNIFSTTSTEK